MQALINVYYLAFTTCLEAIRHRALWAIVFLSILLSMVNVVFASIFSWDIGKVSIEFGLSAVAFTGLLLVFFLGMKILADDLERNRVYMILSRPVSCWQYITGKYLGLALTLFIATLIIGIGASMSMKYVLCNYASFVPPDFSWLTYVMALACQWMSLLVVLAFSFLCFSFATQPFVSLLLSILTYFVGQNMELLRRVIDENTHAGLISGQHKIFVVISWVFPNLSYFDKKSVAAYGLAFSGYEFLILVMYCLTYCAMMLFLSTLFFNRKELT